MSNVENKSSADIRSEIVDSDIPSTIARDTELPTKSSLGLSNVENKSSATIRSEIVDSDIPSTIARDTELPTKSSLGLGNVENKSSADIRSEIVDSDIPSTIARDTELPTKSSLGLSNVENKSSATIRSEIVDSDIPSTIARDTELPTKTTLGLNNVENKSSATIRGEIVDSDIPSTIARDSELPTKSSLGLSNVENKSSATIRGEIVASDIPTITSSKISDLDISALKADINATSTKVVTGKAIFDQYGSSGGGATDIDDLSDVLKVGSYQNGQVWSYDQTSSKFKNTRDLLLLSVNSSSLISSNIQSDTLTVPTIHMGTVVETETGGGNVKMGRISTAADFIIKLDAGNVSGTTRRFRIEDGAGNIAFQVDENGAICLLYTSDAADE